MRPKPGLPDGMFSNLKVQILVTFEGPWNYESWYFLLPFGIYYGHLV
jgi:hypothetical protein